MSLRSFVLLASLGLGASSFFQMFKSATPAVHTQDNNAVRGVPEYLHGKYLDDTFVCDGGKTRINKSSVNDNYCDCADKSDEPGTSACGSFNTFHCINKGFKMILLPASRVDDHVCDCCDGSDEAYGICANTCDAAAEKERAALAGATAAYKVGSAARAALIQNVVKEKSELAEKLPAIAADIDRTKGLIASVKASIDWMKIKSNEAKETAVSAATVVIDDLLNIKNLDESSLSHLLSKLITATGSSEEDITRLSEVSAAAPAAPITSTSDEDDLHDHDHEHDDHHHDEDDYSQDGYGDDIHHNHEHHEHLEDDIPPPAAEEQQQIPKCDFVLHSNDDRLLPICRGENPQATAVKLLKGLLKDHNNHGAFMLLTGYNKINNHFNGADDFVVTHIETAKGGTCPVAFDGIKEHCELSFHLGEAFNTFNNANDAKEDSDELAALRVELNEHEEQLRTLQVDRNNAENAGRDLDEHKDELDLLALKDQCFDVSDGKFTYSVCVLSRITQKENEGHNTVTLGEYDSKEVNAKDSSLTLHFTKGQHCHAHGPRRADVKVICGPENALKSASEPSTCFYDLLFESPVACTAQFAALNGIAV